MGASGVAERRVGPGAAIGGEEAREHARDLATSGGTPFVRLRVVLAVVLASVAAASPAWAADAGTAWMTNPQHDGELTDSPLRPPLAVRWNLRLGTVTSESTWQRVGATRWRRRGRLTLSATARYPAGRLGSSDRVLVCTRERRPDAFRERVPGDRTCGARRCRGRPSDQAANCGPAPSSARRPRFGARRGRERRYWAIVMCSGTEVSTYAMTGLRMMEA
jgi:hypothetical protein